MRKITCWQHNFLTSSCYFCITSQISQNVWRGLESVLEVIDVQKKFICKNLFCYYYRTILVLKLCQESCIAWAESTFHLTLTLKIYLRKKSENGIGLYKVSGIQEVFHSYRNRNIRRSYDIYSKLSLQKAELRRCLLLSLLICWRNPTMNKQMPTEPNFIFVSCFLLDLAFPCIRFCIWVFKDIIYKVSQKDPSYTLFSL